MRQFLVKQNPEKRAVIAGPWITAKVVTLDGKEITTARGQGKYRLTLELEAELPPDIIDWIFKADSTGGFVVFGELIYRGGFTAEIDVFCLGDQVQNFKSVRFIGVEPVLFRGIPETDSFGIPKGYMNPKIEQLVDQIDNSNFQINVESFQSISEIEPKKNKKNKKRKEKS